MSKKKIVFGFSVLTLAIVCLVCRSLFSTTYYVEATGSDSNEGSKAHPFLTIAHAEMLAKHRRDIIHIDEISSSTDTIKLSHNCQVDGDVSLSGTASLAVTDAILTVKGNIVLGEKAQLMVTNGGLTLPQTYESQYNITLNDSSQLRMTNSLLVTNGTSKNNFSLSLDAKNNSVVDFDASKKSKHSWLLGNFHDRSQLSVSNSTDLPTEIYPSDSSRISMTNSDFGGLWLDFAPGSSATINVPQRDARGNFDFDFGQSPGFNYSVHLATAHTRLGLNSHPNSSMTVNGRGLAGANDIDLVFGYYVDANRAPVSIHDLEVGSDVTRRFTDQGRHLSLNHVNLNPFSWQVYVSQSNGFPVAVSNSKINEIAASTNGLVNISNCVLQLAVTGAVGPGSQMNITGSDIWSHDIQARHGGHMRITNSRLHGNFISVVGRGSSITLSNVEEKQNASVFFWPTFPNGIPANVNGVPLFNPQNPLGQSSQVRTADGGVVTGAPPSDKFIAEDGGDTGAKMSSADLPDKVHRIQKGLPSYLAQHGPGDVAPLAHALGDEIKKHQFQDAEKTADQILQLLQKAQ